MSQRHLSIITLLKILAGCPLKSGGLSKEIGGFSVNKWQIEQRR